MVHSGKSRQGPTRLFGLGNNVNSMVTTIQWLVLFPLTRLIIWVWSGCERRRSNHSSFTFCTSSRECKGKCRTNKSEHNRTQENCSIKIDLINRTVFFFMVIMCFFLVAVAKHLLNSRCLTIKCKTDPNVEGYFWHFCYHLFNLMLLHTHDFLSYFCGTQNNWIPKYES